MSNLQTYYFKLDFQNVDHKGPIIQKAFPCCHVIFQQDTILPNGIALAVRKLIFIAYIIWLIKASDGHILDFTLTLSDLK